MTGLAITNNLTLNYKQKMRETLRTILIGLIAVAGALGLNTVVPILDFAVANLDAVSAAVVTLGAFVTGIWMYVTKKKTTP